MKESNITIHKALSSLRPKAEWTAHGDEYEGIQWMDENQTLPSKAEVLAEVVRLQEEASRTAYREHRAREYPPMEDYLDAVVKGDQEQIDRYIAACLAVKAKYPKPE